MLIALCVLPYPAAAQTWADAYRKGDYQAAANELHPLVLKQTVDMTFSGPEPARHLATMYAEGLGVSRDPILACGLAQVARHATDFVAPKYADRISQYMAVQKEADDFVRGLCDRISESDRQLASWARGGCFALGMPEGELMVGSQQVRVGRAGLVLASVDETDQGSGSLGCLLRVLRVRALTIDPPDDAAPGVLSRNFVELLGWRTMSMPGSPEMRHVLMWLLYELRGKRIVEVAQAEIDVTDAWPEPMLPADFDARLKMEMIRSGHVRWRMGGAPPKRGWLMFPETR
jgi:hypothetical protein